MLEINDLLIDDFVKNDMGCLLFYSDCSFRSHDMVNFFKDLQVNFFNIKMAKINMDECVESVIEFNIHISPSIIFICRGVVVEKAENYMSREQIKNKLNALRKLNESK